MSGTSTPNSRYRVVFQESDEKENLPGDFVKEGVLVYDGNRNDALYVGNGAVAPGSFTNFMQRLSRLEANDLANTEQIATLTADSQTKTQQIATLTADNATLTADSQTKTQQIATLTADNQTKTQQIDTLTQQIATLNAQVQHLQGRLDDSARLYNDDQDEINSLKEEKKELQSRIADLTIDQGRIDELRSGYDHATCLCGQHRRTTVCYPCLHVMCNECSAIGHPCSACYEEIEEHDTLKWY